MSDSAIITTESREEGIYLHYFGTPEYVFAFLKYCELQGFRPPEKDIYGWARLAQVISNFIPDGLGVGIGLYDRLSMPFDNGDYIIENWKVVDRIRLFDKSKELETIHVSPKSLHMIDERMPSSYQLGPYLDSVSVPTSSLSVFDLVWFRDFEGPRPLLCPVVGFGENGEGRSAADGDPYVLVFSPLSSKGCLRRLTTDSCRIPPKK